MANVVCGVAIEGEANCPSKTMDRKVFVAHPSPSQDFVVVISESRIFGNSPKVLICLFAFFQNPSVSSSHINLDNFRSYGKG